MVVELLAQPLRITNRVHWEDPAKVDKLPANTVVVLLGDSRRADNLVWWPVRATLAGGRSVEGWVAQLSPANEVLLAGI